jgi:4-amino-4-deoxy-L-arabinose transferase-like glycosyltransferase
MSGPSHGPGRTGHLIGVGLAACYLVALLASAGNLGFARDEGFYFKAAKDYQRWFDILADDPSRALTDKVIDNNWRYNREHPALMKVLFGFSHRIFHDWLGLLQPSTAYRLPGMLAGCLIVYLLFVWGAAVFDRSAGLFAAAAFALMPRIFYHAHLACFDVAITATWLLVAYLYWRSLGSWRFGLLAGIAFGLALGVKLNAFFIPFVLLLHYLALIAHRRLTDQGGALPARPKPWAFLFGLVLAPPIFIGHWPWLWHDTWTRLQSYVGFHAGHAHYNTAYFGENIIAAPTPISLPTVMTGITVPTVILLLAVGGALILLRRHLPSTIEDRVASWWEPSPESPRHGHDLLVVICLVFPIALISWPSVPIFGGTKHWMPAMPFIALIAGAGISRLATLASQRFRGISARAVRAMVILFLIVPLLQQTVTSHPFGLASYVPLAGGAPGGADMGMTRQFWGYTTAGVLPFLNQRTPRNGRVYFHDTAGPAVGMFRQDGSLRRDIKNANIKGSDLALVHHELHMISVDTYIWNRYGVHNPVHVLTYQGVPIVSVYEAP